MVNACGQRTFCTTKINIEWSRTIKIQATVLWEEEKNKKVLYIISWWPWGPGLPRWACWAWASSFSSGSNRSHHGLCILGGVPSTPWGTWSASFSRRTPLARGTCFTLKDEKLKSGWWMSANISHFSGWYLCLYQFQNKTRIK